MASALIQLNDDEFKNYSATGKAIEKLEKNIASRQSGSSDTLGIDASTSTTTNNPQSQLNTITGGGRSIKNVVINLGSLIAENTNIFKEGETPESAEDFIDKLTTSLQLVVNDTNYAV